MNRPEKKEYYLNIAKTVASRSTCLRRRFGAVIVQNDRIVSTGYNGAPCGRLNCTDLGFCVREKLEIPRGERYELCRSVHAEANAIIQGSPWEMEGATLYLVGLENSNEFVAGAEPCSMCKRLIINAGIKTVVTPDRGFDVSLWVSNDESVYGSDSYLREIIRET